MLYVVVSYEQDAHRVYTLNSAVPCSLHDGESLFLAKDPLGGLVRRLRASIQGSLGLLHHNLPPTWGSHKPWPRPAGYTRQKGHRYRRQSGIRTMGTEIRKPLLPSCTYFADGDDMLEVQEIVEWTMLSVGTMWPLLCLPIYTVKYPAGRFRSVIVGSVHFDIP